MLNYLEKFNNLPPAVKQQVSTPLVLSAVADIGKRYQLDLANVVMRVMIKEIDVRYLANYFVTNNGFDQARAQHLENELKEKVLADVMNYLYRKPIIPVATDESGVVLTDKEDDYWHNKIDSIIQSANLSLGSSDLDKRLHNILLTYLKHIRDRLATIDALTKPFDSGGIGLDKMSATNLLTAVDSQHQLEEKLEIHKPMGIPVLEDKAVYSRDVDYDFAKEMAKKSSATAPPSLAPLTPAVVTAPVSASVKSVTSEMPVMPSTKTPPPAKPTKAKPSLPIAKMAKEVTADKPIEKMHKTESGKIKMDDIQGPPKVFTPVDELRYMTLKNMRNLDVDPWQAIEKIKLKLVDLQKEDYGKMVAGIKAFKQSPLNKLYVAVYQEAMNAGQSGASILQAKQKQDPNSLTEPEFEAIIKLNQELKF